MSNCAFCDHSEKEHCKGGVPHTDHKEDSRMVAIKWRKGTHNCVSRHCEVPLCCCVSYQGPLPAAYTAENTPEEMEAYRDALARDTTQGACAAQGREGM